MNSETIGFIGIGSQGGPMAHRILDAGLDLVVWARRSEALEPYTAKGATAALDIAALGSRCDHVGICVVNDADVQQVCDQLLPAMKPGGRIAIHSTVLPDICIELERKCAARGIALLDAPVSGGSPAAEIGTLTVMCGGSQEAFDASRTVFETFGKLIVLLGPVGSGQRAKLINNAMLAAHMGIAQAAFEASNALGIDRAALTELITHSTGRSGGFETYARLSSPAAFAVGGPLLLKDMLLLQAALPGHEGAEALRAAAHNFLTAANSGD